MSQSPLQKIGSKRYEDAWRAINVLIRSDGSWSGHERNTCYLNLGNGLFQDVSFVSGLDFPVDGRSFVAFDIDHDGDLDLALKSRNGPQVQILRNDFHRDTTSGNRALVLELVGRQGNWDAVGAKAILETDQRQLVRVVQSGSGFLSQSSRRIHFGLLPQERPVRLEIFWPGGSPEKYSEVPESGVLRLIQGKSEVEKIAALAPPRISAQSPALIPQAVSGTWLLEPLPVPEFALPGLDGQIHQLSGYRGRKVLLNFWATWCPPCRKELAELAARDVDFRSAGLQLLAVSVDDENTRDQVRDVASRIRIPFPVLFATQEVTAVYSTIYRHLFDRWRDQPIPTSFLLDEQGRIIKVYTSATNADAILADCRSPNSSAIPFQGVWYIAAPGRNYTELATALAERGLRTHAQVLFAAALQAGHSGPDLYNNFATLLSEKGEFDEAEKLLRKSLELDPEQYAAQVNLGVILVRRDQPRQALALLERAASLRTDDVLVHSTLGSAYFRLGDFPAAERSYRECLRLEPSVAQHAFNLGSVLAAAGRFGDALASFEDARKLGLATAGLLNGLGILYVETGKPELGRAAFEEALRIDPSHYESHLNFATYLMRSGDFEQALSWIEKARQLDPGKPEASFLKAQLLLSNGKAHEAREVLKQLLQAHPNHPGAAQLLERLP